jgi:hypothetical protein
MPIVILLLSLLGIFLRLWRLHKRDLWCDEIYQFHCMQGAFKPFWVYQTYGDHTSFPGEYLLQYPLVQIFGMNKWGLVAPHLIFNIVGFYLLYEICQIYCRSWVGYIASFLIYTLNDNLMFHSLEFRPYAMLPVIALASLYFSHLLLSKEFQSSKSKMILLGILFFLMINYHIYGIAACLLPLAYTIFYNIKKGNNLSSFPWLWLLVVIIFSFPVWLWYASFNHFGLSPNLKAQSYVDTFQFIDDPREHFISFFKAVMGNLTGIRKGGAIWIITFIAFLIPAKERLLQVAFAVLLIIIPVILILYFDIRSHYWFLDRQFVWVMPWAALFIGWVLDSSYIYAKDYFFARNQSKPS